MKSIFLAAAFAAAALVVPNVLIASNAIGETAGQFAVQQGRATYAIELQLPPGLGEMKPDLSLVYMSGAPAGPLGLGWSVSGLSAITLCPQTIAHDGAHKVQTLQSPSSDSRFCMDGMRLIPVPGATYGSSNMEFRKEIDDFSRIKGLSWPSGASGPTGFTVQTKAGQTMTYGQTATARSHGSGVNTNASVAWYLERVEDTVGNAIVFVYERHTGALMFTQAETLIKEIRWTENVGAGQPVGQAKAVFQYANRPKRYITVMGRRIEQMKRMTSIDIMVGTTKVREYKLQYRTDNVSPVDQIASIQECALTLCLPATTFEWQGDNNGYQRKNAPIPGALGGIEWRNVGDTHGNGIPRIISPHQNQIYIKSYDPVSSTFTASQASTVNDWGTADRTYYGDFDGDGRIDIATIIGNMLRIRYFNGDTVTERAPAITATWGLPQHVFATDVNGDGRTDIVYFSNLRTYVYLSTGRSFAPVQEWNYGVSPGTAPVGRYLLADFNGDGINQIATIESNGQIAIITLDAATQTVSRVNNPGLGTTDMRAISIGDFDGNGTLEIGAITMSGSPRINYVCPTLCNGASTGVVNLPALHAGASLDHFWLVDVNGDGFTDIAYGTTGRLNFLINQNGTFTQGHTSGSGTWGSTVVADFNFDGLPDFVTTSGSTTTMWESFSDTRAIKAVQSGLGSRVEVTYSTSTDAASHLRQTNDTYPNLYLDSPTPLVTEVWSSHGAGSLADLRGTRYVYANLRYNLHGRGMLGFEVETIQDIETGNYEINQYSVTFPYIGMLLQADQYIASGQRLSTIANSLAFINTQTGSRHPYVKYAFHTDYDESGQVKRINQTASINPDGFGNFLTVKSSIWDSSSGPALNLKVVTSQFDNDTTAWRLGRLTRSTVEHHGLNGLEGSRTVAFSYNMDGLLSQEVVEPDAVGTSRYLATTYGYDAFGHKNQISMTGYGADGSSLPARSTTMTTAFDLPNNRINVTTTNALGHTSVQHLSLVHGGVLETVDANGHRHTTTYDAFGRATKQVQYAGKNYGVNTDIFYEAPSGGPSNAVLQIRSVDTAGGSQTQWQDMKGRTLRQASIAMNGDWIYEETKYDTQGRVIETARPSYQLYGAPRAITQYDDRGRIVLVDMPGTLGSRAVTHYLYNRYTTTIIDPEQNVRVEVRDALDQVVSVSEGSGASTLNFSYDAYGNLRQSTDAMGQITTVNYDAMGRKIAQDDPALGQWTYAWNSFGEMETQTDAKGVVTQNTYDVLGRVIQRVKLNAASDVLETHTWTFDTAQYGKGLLAVENSVMVVNGVNQTYRETYLYNNRSLPREKRTLIDGTTYTVSTVYDLRNRPTETTYPGGFKALNEYNSYGYLTAVSSPAETESTVYSQSAISARFDEVNAELGQSLSELASWQSQVDQLNQAYAAAQASIAQLEAQAVQNNPLIATYRQHAATFTSYQATLAVTIAAYERQVTSLRRHAELLLDLKTNSFFSGTAWGAYLTTQSGYLEQRAQAQEAMVQSTEALSRDLYGANAAAYIQMANNLEAQALGSQYSLLQHYRQQLQQNRASLGSTLAERAVVQAQADRYGQMSAMAQSALNRTDRIVWWQASQTDAEGRMSRELLGNGIVTERDYEGSTGHLLAIRSGTLASSAVQDVGYEYDHVNNVTHRWDNNLGMSGQFGYDYLDRLKTAQINHSASGSPLNQNLTYQYDAIGNLQSRNRTGGPGNLQNNYTYDWVNNRYRLTNVSGVGTMVYDANGNITTTGNRQLTYDGNNRVTRIQQGSRQVDYAYGAAGQRYRKAEISPDGNELTHIVGSGYEKSTVSGTGSNHTEHRYFIQAGGQTIAARVIKTEGAITTKRAEYYHRDALNSVEVITDALGRIVRRYHYLPFGERTDITAFAHLDPSYPTASGVAALAKRGYTGHEQLDEFGLIHMNGRVFDVKTARFTSADPHIQYATSTQNHNRYAYVHNNPLKYTDPSGYWLSKLWKGIKDNLRTIVAIAVTFVAPVLVPYIGAFWAGFSVGFAAGLIAGRGDFRSGLVGGISGGLLSKVGAAYTRVEGAITFGEKVVAHGIIGGSASVANGGKFGHGLLASSASALVSGANLGKVPMEGQIVIGALTGGVAATLGGGKFGNGAISGAFSYALNHCLSGGCSGDSLNASDYKAIASEAERLYEIFSSGGSESFLEQNIHLRGLSRGQLESALQAALHDTTEIALLSRSQQAVLVGRTLGGGLSLPDPGGNIFLRIGVAAVNLFRGTQPSISLHMQKPYGVVGIPCGANGCDVWIGDRQVDF